MAKHTRELMGELLQMSRYLLLCLLVQLISLTSTTQKLEASELHILHSLWGHDDFFERLTNDFNRLNSGTKLKFIYRNVHQNEIHQHVSILDTTAILMPSDKLGASMNYLTPLPKAWLPESIAKTYIDTVKLSNIVYGVPIMSGNHLVMSYNKSLVEKPSSSWEELLQQAPSIREKGAAPVGMPVHSPYYLISFFSAFGGEVFDASGRPNIHSSENIEALNFFKSLYYKDLFRKGCDMRCGKEDFHAGKVAYSIDIDGAARENIKQLGDNLVVAFLPSYDGNMMRSFFSTLSLYLPYQQLTESDQVALMRIIDFLSSADTQQELATGHLLLPVHKSVERLVATKSDDLLLTIYQQLQRSIPMPPTEAMHRIWIKMGELQLKFVRGELSPEAFLEQVQKYATTD